MKNEKILYGIGIGPGEPDLITLRGRNIIEKAECIFVPKSSDKEASLAKEIVSALDVGEKKWIEIHFPMTGDEKLLNEKYKDAADLIIKEMRNLKTAAYLTLGDTLLYSTFIYLARALNEATDEIKIETVPGITTASAAAAKFNFPLAEKKEKVLIAALPDTTDEMKKMIAENDTVIFYKASKHLPDLFDVIEQMNLSNSSVFCSRLGLEDEKLIDGRFEPFVLPEGKNYLSTVIIRRKP
ncbi:MAG: precorrin-2 C(20)-methyltransferase [Spirochaetia bacterium]|nr:precorrin-2 C(20)-methyltransferase [Spirochaetia bacterium]